MHDLDIRMPDFPRSFMLWGSSMLGVEAESLDGQFAQYFGVKEGVLVRAVPEDSAADKAGIKAGDVIIRVEDAHVATPADISSRIRSLHGKSVPSSLMRDHKELTVTVAIADDDPGRIQITPFQSSDRRAYPFLARRISPAATQRVHALSRHSRRPDRLHPDQQLHFACEALPEPRRCGRHLPRSAACASPGLVLLRLNPARACGIESGRFLSRR